MTTLSRLPASRAELPAAVARLWSYLDRNQRCIDYQRYQRFFSSPCLP